VNISLSYVVFRVTEPDDVTITEGKHRHA